MHFFSCSGARQAVSYESRERGATPAASKSGEGSVVMSTGAMRSGAGAGLFRHNIVTLFLAGAIAVLLFQQGAIAILHAYGLAPAPFTYTRTQPLGVPQIWSFAFWGGIWGIVFGLAESRFPQGLFYYIAAFLFGAIFPVLVLWFIVFPLKGLPMAAGWNVNRMWVQMLHHGAWGLGTGILLRWRG